MAKKSQSFEQSITRLDEIVRQLEQGNVPLEDRVQLALLLAKGYAALDSRPYGGSLALALYPLKETE